MDIFSHIFGDLYIWEKVPLFLICENAFLISEKKKKRETKKERKKKGRERTHSIILSVGFFLLK